MKNKLSKRTILLNKANKILKKHYAQILNGRDLTEDEIMAEVKNALRKWDDAVFLVNYDWIHSLDKEEWEKIAGIVELVF